MSGKNEGDKNLPFLLLRCKINLLKRGTSPDKEMYSSIE